MSSTVIDEVKPLVGVANSRAAESEPFAARATHDHEMGARRFRVLIVDDEEPVVQFVERTLHAAGYDTSTASDGRTALAVAATAEPFDLLLTDLMMPEMTGDALACALRRQDPDLPVLYLTGFSDQLFKERSQLWANETFVDKPVSMQALREAVSLALFGHTKGPPQA